MHDVLLAIPSRLAFILRRYTRGCFLRRRSKVSSFVSALIAAMSCAPTEARGTGYRWRKMNSSETPLTTVLWRHVRPVSKILEFYWEWGKFFTFILPIVTIGAYIYKNIAD